MQGQIFPRRIQVDKAVLWENINEDRKYSKDNERNFLAKQRKWQKGKFKRKINTRRKSNE